MSDTETKPLVYITKTEALERAISDMAKALAPGSKLPSMSQLGKTFGVSKVTLDIALKELERKEIIVRKNGVGIFAADNIRLRTIGLVFGFDVFNPSVALFYRHFLQIAQSQAPAHQVQFRYYFDLPRSDQGTPSYHDLISDVKSERVQGLMGVGILPDTMQELNAMPVPIVNLASGHKEQAFHEVGVDIGEMVRMGVKALAADGCTRIGLITSSGIMCRHNGEVQSVKSVFRETLKEAGRAYSAPLYFEYPAAPPSRVSSFVPNHIEWSRQSILRFFSKTTNPAEQPDGLLILDDQFAYGALLALDELKLQAGKDIRIATEAIRDVPQFPGHALIRLEVDPTLIVNAMHRTLKALMDGQPLPNAPIAIAPIVTYQTRTEPRLAYA